MQIRNILLLLIVITLLSACFKDDEMIQPHPRGDVITDTIALTDNYKFQVYYSLDSAGVVKSNRKTETDLGFECSSDGWRILLNSSTFMMAADLGVVEFGQKYDTAGTKLKFDKSDGNPDSTAIGIWFTVKGADTISNGHVYAITRGIDELGNTLGLIQFIADSLKNGVFYFRYAPLSGGTVSFGSVQKDNRFNYMWYSFRDHVVRGTEPDADRYELLFTQYTTLLFTDEGDPYPYLLTGVLINRTGVSAAIDTVHPFQDITRDQATGLNYSQAVDVIGWDWKYYNFNSGVYSIRPNISYVIRNRGGYYFKLRFIGFYDKNGSKGYPVIEYQAL